MKLAAVLAASIVTLGCKQQEAAPEKLPVPEPPPPAPAPVERAPPDPEAAEAERLMQEMTRGALDGSRLMRFAPATLAGITRSHRDEQVFAVAAAYELDGGGGYANLDIKNSFRRGGIDLEDQLMRACKRTEKIAGHAACLIVKPDRASAHWDLPDRLTVDLSAPDEQLLRKMAAELPLAEIAELSKAPSDP